MSARVGRMHWTQFQKDYQKSTSTSTSHEEPPLLNLPKAINNEKSELCKKYIENGVCPYKNKCKFAHGSHQLRYNNQINSLYKTKQCIAFFKNGSCPYGQRCNFLHKNLCTLKQSQKSSLIRKNFGDFFEICRESSRLFPN